MLGHTNGIMYDPSKADDFENFWLLLCRLLPCDYCQKNLTSKMNKYSIKKYLGDKSQAFFYTYFIHDLANQHINQYSPDVPKVSPPYDVIKEYYVNNTRKPSFWKRAFWDTLFILSVTLKPQNSAEFIKFLWVSSSLLPSAFSQTFQNCLRKYSPFAYVRNNYDTFFYIYLLYDCTSPNPEAVPPFDDLKSYYFHALGTECKECSV